MNRLLPQVLDCIRYHAFKLLTTSTIRLVEAVRGKHSSRLRQSVGLGVTCQVGPEGKLPAWQAASGLEHWQWFGTLAAPL